MDLLLKERLLKRLKCCSISAVVVAMVFFVVWYVYRCSDPPFIELKEFTIRDMAVFHNATTNSTPWQLTTDTNVTLSIRNQKFPGGCSTRLRRVEVKIYYNGTLVLASEILAGPFSLKPEKKRAVRAELKGERFPTANKLGPELDTALLSTNVTLWLEIDNRYDQVGSSTKDGKPRLTITACRVFATPPSRSNSSLGILLTKKCDRQHS